VKTKKSGGGKKTKKNHSGVPFSEMRKGRVSNGVRNGRGESWDISEEKILGKTRKTKKNWGGGEVGGNWFRGKEREII